MFTCTFAILLAYVSIASTQRCSADPRYPTCDSTDLGNGVWRIPSPPTNPSWTSIALSAQHPIYTIPPTPPTGGVPWGPGATYGGIPWGDPRSLNTELCACGQGRWAMTFDDGPSRFTGGVLDALRGARATFFVIGASVVNEAGNADVLRRVFNAGHQIGTHQPMTTLTTDQIVSEIVWNAVAIYRVIGRVPRYFRPPYGDIDDRLRNVLLAFRLRPVLWTLVSDDTLLPDPPTAPSPYSLPQLLERFRTTTAMRSMPGLSWPPPGAPYPGFISLQHDVRAAHVEVARATVPIILDEGRFVGVTVAECEGGSPYLADGDALVELVKQVANGDGVTLRKGGSWENGTFTYAEDEMEVEKKFIEESLNQDKELGNSVGVGLDGVVVIGVLVGLIWGLWRGVCGRKNRVEGEFDTMRNANLESTAV
ncbi:hypothetical protein BC829DRAFT_398186 [Chytridium lagenaria]|nr:hypothetical protein BC829DRAFT_398186 [Chytridium lagenaria]